MTVSSSGRRSVKQQIAAELRGQILDGTLGDEERLPTEAELMDKHGVARNTARDALALLVNEGLIVARRPHGYFVRSRKRMEYRPQSDLRAPDERTDRDSFLTEQTQAGRSPTQSIDVAIVEAPRDVARRLKLGPEDLAVVRRRLRYLDGEPFYSNDSYFPLALVQGTEIMVPHDIDRGANVVLAEHGHPQARAVDEFYVRMPTPKESERLDLAPGTPVAYHLITGYDLDDHPVRCVVNVLPGDHHVIMFERPGLHLTGNTE